MNTFMMFVMLLLGLGVGYFLQAYFMGKKIKDAEAKGKEIISEAERAAEAKKKEVELEAKEHWYKTRTEFEKETKEKRIELQTLEKRVQQRQENLESKIDLLDQKEKEYLKKTKEVEEIKAELKKSEQRFNDLIKEELQKLEKISLMSKDEAKDELKNYLMEEAKLETSLKIKKFEEETKNEANNKAKEIIGIAIQKLSAEQVAETTVSSVELPSDEMKGKIIGREGRNIRALEIATGVDLIIDDTPGTVIVSSFDPIRREIARVSLEKLINDGRIHPGRIENIVEKSKKEVANIVKEEGERASFEMGVGGLHPEEIKLLGRLKFRTSYSQNVLQHSKEVAYLASIMAAELGIDPKMAKRAGLLHDLGKAVDQQTEGTHVQIGVDLAHRYNEPKVVINAIAAHHEDTEPKFIESILVAAADALSASRPGARREILETYIKRLEKLEEIGDSFKGVEKTYAIQAGREVRIIVEPKQVSDAELFVLVKEISKRIEKEMAYPGEIRVTAIRETRAVEYAR